MSKQLMLKVVELVQQTAPLILPFWQQQLDIHTKSDDSPVTEADLTAHRFLAAELMKLAPEIPVLSEEDTNISLETRNSWQRWWLVDPLDGTKEFIDGRSDFTVNVALIEQGKVVFGVVGVPVTGACYYGGKQLGAWLQDTPQAEPRVIQTRPANQAELLVVASHRHTSPTQQQLLSQLQNLAKLELKSIGSSLKFCLLASGQADCYPRFAPTSQWDTAAAQGVLEGAGGVVLNTTAEPLTYTMHESYLNPFFIAIADASYWQQPIVDIIKHLEEK